MGFGASWSQNLIPWFRALLDGWGFPGLGVPDTLPRNSDFTLGPVGGPGAVWRPAHPPLSPARPSCAGSGVVAQDPTGGLGLVRRKARRLGSQTGSATVSGILEAPPVQPPAALPAPPLTATTANPREGPAHPGAPLGKFNLAATPLAGPAFRGL